MSHNNILLKFYRCCSVECFSIHLMSFLLTVIIVVNLVTIYYISYITFYTFILTLFIICSFCLIIPQKPTDDLLF